MRGGIAGPIAFAKSRLARDGMVIFLTVVLPLLLLLLLLSLLLVHHCFGRGRDAVVICNLAFDRNLDVDE